jgi:SAM-dependent methyltransferase
MSPAGDYTFQLDAAELERFRRMAAHAESHEHELWGRAGVGPGATVVDLGCGPGALLPILAGRIAPGGRLIGVDADPIACATARAISTDIAGSVRIVAADAAHTGLRPGTADVVMCRNVLIHNGRRVRELLGHAAALLRPGGRLISAEPDVAGINFGAAQAEREYEQRWAAMTSADGNDPALGRGERLPQLLQHHGWEVLEVVSWLDQLVIDRSPAWAAADAIVSRGFATSDEVRGWRRALADRQASGPLHCTVPVTAIAARPRHRRDFAGGGSAATSGFGLATVT